MACKPVCQLCEHFVTVNSLTYGNGILALNIPGGTYFDGKKYCMVVARNLPDGVPIGTPVYVTIGDGTQTYALVDRCCRPVTADRLSTRCRYSTVVQTGTSGGVFRVLGKVCFAQSRFLPGIDGTAPTTEGGDTT